MSIYKEGYYIIQTIQSQIKQIYIDACDCGAPTRKGDTLWNMASQLVKWYGIQGTRQQINYPIGTIVGTTVTHDVRLINEWNIGRVEQYRITYITTRGNQNHDGYLQIERIE